jgi:virginiamycin B lyase
MPYSRPLAVARTLGAINARFWYLADQLDWTSRRQLPHAYAVYVDDKEKVWVTDFNANAILSFDPQSDVFESFPSNKPDAAVRQLNGRAGEVWGAESGADRLVVVRATGKEVGN